ncbi:MAG: prephenate dehydrogenase/arogenate dehydrogenase family protein [Deltaproteobacteria bacterium]|nr:prephenate dehydrogenase/arogenate dehydrogenase family protein [Deltaproteobacteria bacterium]
MAKTVYFKKVAVIGVGLIGGSIALVLRKKGLAGGITGIGRGIENLKTAKRLGIIDSFTLDIAEGVAGADLVIVAVPALKIADTVKKALPHLRPPCIITDVGSVKSAVVEAIEPLLPEGVAFVPGHPIAGTENSGADAAFMTLFKGRLCILTPARNTDKDALKAVRAVWKAAGSRVVSMDAETHDRVLAAVSHLPHMIAYTLVNAVAESAGGVKDILGYSAGGFKDFTRIASSSPEMWTDICAMNRDNIVGMIAAFEKRLEALKKMIVAGDLAGIRNAFERGKALRDAIAHKGAVAVKK